MPRPDHPVLGADQLNRATLARQLLLEPSSLATTTAVEAIGGLQAQEPASPYLGLWTRLEGFDATAFDRAFQDRDVVKASLMRATLHVVSRDDYLRLMPAMLPMLRRLTRRERGGLPSDARLTELAAAGLEFASVPRTNSELRDHLAKIATEFTPDDAWWWVRRSGTFVHVPSDVPWSFGRRSKIVTANAWFDGAPFATEAAGITHLVRRYLSSFGPATTADIAAWSRLPVARLRPGIEALDAGGGLRRFTDERGRVLLDVAGAPLPDGDVAAPPRYLPMWDSVLLAHADRSRIISDERRRTVIAFNGDTLPTFLVDGRVAGLWWAEPGRIVREPFARLDADTKRALDREAERLLAFLAPLEPRVYARYRGLHERRRAAGLAS